MNSLGIYSTLPIALHIFLLIPLFGAFLPCFFDETVLVTSEKAFLALLMTPFFPNEVLNLIVFIPLETARLKLETFFLAFIGAIAKVS